MYLIWKSSLVLLFLLSRLDCFNLEMNNLCAPLGEITFAFYLKPPLLVQSDAAHSSGSGDGDVHSDSKDSSEQAAVQSHSQSAQVDTDPGDSDPSAVSSNNNDATGDGVSSSGAAGPGGAGTAGSGPSGGGTGGVESTSDGAGGASSSSDGAGGSSGGAGGTSDGAGGASSSSDGAGGTSGGAGGTGSTSDEAGSTSDGAGGTSDGAGGTSGGAGSTSGGAGGTSGGAGGAGDVEDGLSTSDGAGQSGVDQNPEQAGGGGEGPEHGDGLKMGGYLFDVLQRALSDCCGPEVVLKPGQRFSSEGIMENEIGDEDFIMPVVLHKAMSNMFDTVPEYSFVPIITSPGMVLLRPKSGRGSEVWETILQAWPLLLLVTASCGLAGILMWAVDRVYNPDEFPKSFLKGFWEGIWWAFVTMTTVGYGDKTPRSAPGRCFGIIWITVGILMMSVLTATLAAAFVQQEAPFGEITGKKIAFIKNTIEEVAVLTRSAYPNSFPKYDEMLENITHDSDLDAALIDPFAYSFYEDTIKSNDLQIVGNIVEPASIGYIFNNVNSNVTRCLVKKIAAQRSTLAQLSERVSRKHQQRTRSSPAAKKSHSVFSQTLLFVYITASLFLLCLVIACLWEFLYWRPKINKNTVSNISLNSKSMLHAKY